MIFIWKRIFKINIVADFSAPLTANLLHDPYVKIVENLLYIYSMETFVYSLLNVSSRNKDSSKIETLGPLSLALASVVAGAESYRTIDSGSLPLCDGTNF